MSAIHFPLHLASDGYPSTHVCSRAVNEQRRARMRNAQGLNVASERALLRSEEGQSFDDESETDERQAQRSKLFVPAAPLFGRTRSSDPG